MLSRRGFLHATATSAVTVTAISGRVQAAAIPEAPATKDGTTQPPFTPPAGVDYNPVVTLNVRAMAGGHDRCSGRRDPRSRIHCRQSRRLAVPLP
jgi:hypothetical protein